MDKEQSIVALAALAQPTRLDAFRLLVAHEPAGLAAGALARRLAVPHNTLSSHLSVLAHAGLVNATKHGRSIVYRADIERLQCLTGLLLEDCCGGNVKNCAPAIGIKEIVG